MVDKKNALHNKLKMVSYNFACSLSSVLLRLHMFLSSVC